MTPRLPSELQSRIVFFAVTPIERTPPASDSERNSALCSFALIAHGWSVWAQYYLFANVSLPNPSRAVQFIQVLEGETRFGRVVKRLTLGQSRQAPQMHHFLDVKDFQLPRIMGLCNSVKSVAIFGVSWITLSDLYCRDAREIHYIAPVLSDDQCPLTLSYVAIERLEIQQSYCRFGKLVTNDVQRAAAFTLPNLKALVLKECVMHGGQDIFRPSSVDTGILPDISTLPALSYLSLHSTSPSIQLSPALFHQLRAVKTNDVELIQKVAASKNMLWLDCYAGDLAEDVTPAIPTSVRVLELRHGPFPIPRHHDLDKLIPAIIKCLSLMTGLEELIFWDCHPEVRTSIEQFCTSRHLKIRLRLTGEADQQDWVSSESRESQILRKVSRFGD